MLDNYTKGACPEFEARLEDLLGGELEGAEKSLTSQHLRDCSACRGAFDSASRISEFLKSSLAEDAIADAGFAHRTMAAIRVEEDELVEENSFWRPMQIMAWRLALSAALALVLLFAYARFVPLPPPSTARIVAQTSDPELIPDPAGRPLNGDEVLLMGAEFSYGK
jgi:anti-sigma factor RsiW